MKLFIDLNEICFRYNVTQVELSERTGIKQPNLSLIKKRRSISLRSLSKIAKAVNETDISRLIKSE
ncbi:transcriptional regulator [Bacillus cereus]|nr:transcriptional regulator [Bacillus cereus]